MKEKIAKLRKLRQVNLWAIGAMWVSLVFIGLMEDNEGPYILGLFVVCAAVAFALAIWRRIWTRKLLSCPYCLRYFPIIVDLFLQGKEETFPCPHCGRQIPAMDWEEKE